MGSWDGFDDGSELGDSDSVMDGKPLGCLLGRADLLGIDDGRLVAVGRCEPLMVGR